MKYSRRRAFWSVSRKSDELFDYGYFFPFLAAHAIAVLHGLL